MHNVNFKIKILTPLYMFGANPNWLELREPSFKGMLRFWWRALKACDDHEHLKSVEEKIFGGTSDEAGKSKIHILITCKKTAVLGDLKNRYGLKWNFNRQQNKLEGDNRGIGYLFYSMLQANRRRGTRPKMYFAPDGSFDISLYSRDDDTDALRNAIAAFWCALNLGGFGSRSRRGAGSLAVVDVKEDTYGLDFIAGNCNNREEIIQWIKENVNRARKIVGPIDKDCRTYSNLSQAAFIISKDGYRTWYEALSDIGNIYADFRYNHRSSIHSGAFGFPVLHRNGSVVKAKYNDNILERRSSPLLFKILKSNNEYYWMALRFAGDFLPDEAKFTWENQHNDVTPSLELLDNFWNTLKANSGEDYSFSDEVKGYD